MRVKAERLLRQLKQYQKSAAVYERARVKLLEKEHRSLGLTDKVVQKELKALGVDVKSLLEDTAVEQEELKKVHKKFLALEKPPILPGDFQIPPDPNVFDVKPPAIEGFGTNCPGLDRGINLALGETNLLVSEQGDGWGWEATAGSPCVPIHSTREQATFW